MAMYPPGEEQAAAQVITQYWSILSESMIFQGWDFGYLQGLFSKSGLYDYTPYEKTLQQLASLFPNGFKRHLSVGMTDLNSGTI